jgi:hypothetical protein
LAVSRYIALVTALVAWAALVLQFVLLVDRMAQDGLSVWHALWRFFGFFTIVANIMVAVVATAMAVRPSSRIAGPYVRFATVSTILIVGIVYSVALRALWSPTGWQAVVDHALHDASPPLFLLAWLTADHGALTWRDGHWALIAPCLFSMYGLARGAVDGWYAYWFMDPNSTDLGGMVLNISVLVGALLVVAYALIWIDRRMARRAQPAEVPIR